MQANQYPLNSAPTFVCARLCRAIVGMATTTAGNFGMATGVALLRLSGDTSRPESFHMTFSSFFGGAVMLLPVAVLLRTAVKHDDGQKQEETKGRYAPLKSEDVRDAAP
eukprot:COSAG02_NODE_1447_length_12575_cov_8.479400_10_plen_109_part_00